MNCLTTYASILLFLWAVPAVAQDTTWVRGVEGRASMETTGRADARAYAIRAARAQAAIDAYGVQILRGFFLQQSELVRNGKTEEANTDVIEVILELAGAAILRQYVIVDSIENIARPGLPPHPEYVVKIDALVARQTERRDASFAVDIDGIRETYSPGDSVVMTIASSQDGYLNLFCFGADGQVYHIFPNTFELDNAVYARKPHRLPGNASYDLPAILPEGRASASETLLAIVTRDKIPFLVGESYQPGKDFAELRRAAMEELMRWITRIPGDRRAETTVNYVIRK